MLRLVNDIHAIIMIIIIVCFGSLWWSLGLTLFNGSKSERNNVSLVMIEV